MKSDGFEFDMWMDNFIASHEGKVRITWSQGSPSLLFSRWVSADELERYLSWTGPQSECPYPDPFNQQSTT